MGQDFKESNDRFRETLEILEKLWHSDEAVAHEGKHFKFGKAYPWPRPVQKPHPPIWVGGQSDATIEWAASNGYHVSHASFLNPIEHIQHVADVFHRAREAKGVARGKQQFGVLQQMYVSEDRRAVERMPEVVIRRNRIHHHLYRDFETSADNHAYVAPNPIDAPEPDRETVLKNLLMGSPEEVLEKVHALEAAGVDHLYVQAAFGLPMQQAIDSVRLFGEKVIQPYNASLRRAAS
jgi:alkanesulfonate monooxygenase SsuD/methylene tetrahydromethanopterin reductase-like flavin-dependent oxidoreductase (luciferase family)